MDERDDDLTVGDRVRNRSRDMFPDGKPQQFGNVVEKYESSKPWMGKPYTLYNVMWDDDPKMSVGHMRRGLERVPWHRTE